MFHVNGMNISRCIRVPRARVNMFKVFWVSEDLISIYSHTGPEHSFFYIVSHAAKYRLLAFGCVIFATAWKQTECKEGLCHNRWSKTENRLKLRITVSWRARTVSSNTWYTPITSAPKMHFSSLYQNHHIPWRQLPRRTDQIRRPSHLWCHKG